MCSHTNTHYNYVQKRIIPLWQTLIYDHNLGVAEKYNYNIKQQKKKKIMLNLKVSLSFGKGFGSV